MRYFALLGLILFSITHSTGQTKKLLYKDATYEEEIRTVQLYPGSTKNWTVLEPAVAKVGQMNLILEFDDLVQSAEEYRAKIIHCDRDWTPSRLSNIDILYDFNEFNITDDQVSSNTKVPYIHYTFRLPQVKLPGNYLLVVYRGTDEKDIILSKRFLVYSNEVSIALQSNLNGLTSTDRNRQQIDFSINYNNYPLQNPMQNVSVTIRQNERWDNAIVDLKPSFLNEGNSQLDYRFFNFENAFYAGNEYRFFDMRSLRNPGQGVQNVNWREYPIRVELMTDLPRIYQAYSHLEDINGDYYIVNVDLGNGDIFSDYTYTNFQLKTDQPLPGQVFVVGKMNNWEKNQTSRMSFDRKSGVYTTEMLLKQGWYNYKYVLESDSVSSNYIEGNHFQTENTYEILVYYRPPNMRSDLLIGYGFYEMNATR